MSVILYVHLKNDIFPFPFPLPYTKVTTLSLLNCGTSLVNFLTACKRLWLLGVIAGTSDSKNPELYYLWSFIFYLLFKRCDVKDHVSIFNIFECHLKNESFKLQWQLKHHLKIRFKSLCTIDKTSISILKVLYLDNPISNVPYTH